LAVASPINKIGFLFLSKNMTFFNKTLKLAKKIGMNWIILAIVSVILANLIVYSKPAWASDASIPLGFSYVLENVAVSSYGDEIIKILNPEVMFLERNSLNRNYLPENNEREVAYVTKIVFTAYNSEVAQCDDTPCVTANGFDVCKHDKEDTIAMNGIKFGTKIRIPELFGDRVFVVRDRMNARYGSNRGDIWMREKSAAKQFGVKVAKVEVLE
jgi:3D (Asp-Asp-Asp) domain-containing protein